MLNYDEEFDVLVIGGGVSGAAAALSAAEDGASVLLVEKTADTGGSSVMSGGFLAFADTPIQRAHGIEDSVERLRRDILEVGEHRNDVALVERYVEEQTDLYGWLVDHGARFWDHVEVNSGQSLPRSHKVDPRQVIDALLEDAASAGRVEVRTNTAATAIERAGSGSVETVVLTDTQGGTKRIRINAGVVLATGGFARSGELLAIFAPSQLRAMQHGGIGNTGDGLRMAWRLGADMRDMGYVKGTFGTHPSTTDAQHEMIFAFYDGAIIVNTEAKRYVDESISYKLLGEATLEQPEATGFMVFDEGIMRMSVPGVRTHDYADALARGLLVSAPTIEELADRLGVPPQQLVSTVASYNDGVTRAGRDEHFGRKSVCNGFGDLRTISEGPFYGFQAVPVIQATYGGLRTDADARVIDVADAPIEGLFAAGEVTGGLHGAAYMTGTSLGKGLLFGRIAGRGAAKRRVEFNQRAVRGLSDDS